MHYLLSSSMVNQSILRAREVFEHFRIYLPDYADWDLNQWEAAGPEADESRDCMLGWDVTDFGSQRYHEIGRTPFTLRNGKAGSDRYQKIYAEKLILDPEGQRAPAHYHRSKREDIVCRAGGNILVQLQTTEPDGAPSQRRFDITVDGTRRVLDPLEIICTPARACASRHGRYISFGERKARDTAWTALGTQ